VRLFIGVELDDRTRAAAADVAERLRQRLTRVDPQLVARWVPPENLHITLWFIGEVADDRAGQVEDALRAPFDEAVFPVVLQGAGAFPPSGPPRVFWIGLAEGQRGMEALYTEVSRRMAVLGHEAERRAYTAHLTIARVKESGRGTARAIRQALADLPAACGRTDVPAVTLFRSRL
jgi:RNA 2',3'-cyclic 3'-phosphodiesterase